MPFPPIGTWLRLGEAVCRRAVPLLQKDYGLETRIVRFHNVYGPLGTYDGGKEKLGSHLAKVALAEDGATSKSGAMASMTRSFMYVDDCGEGLVRLMAAIAPNR